MPNIEIASLKQRAVLWSFAGYNEFGDPTVNEPVEIPCRWESGLREATDAQASPIAVTDEVHVAQVIEAGSILYLGELDDVVGTGTGLITADVLNVVVDYTEAPDIKGRKVQRSVMLQKWSSTLPTVV